MKRRTTLPKGGNVKDEIEDSLQARKKEGNSVTAVIRGKADTTDVFKLSFKGAEPVLAELKRNPTLGFMNEDEAAKRKSAGPKDDGKKCDIESSLEKRKVEGGAITSQVRGNNAGNGEVVFQLKLKGAEP